MTGMQANGKIRSMNSQLMVTIILVLTTIRVEAASMTNANVAADLTNTTRWVGGVVPGGTDTAVWNNVLATPANCTNGAGGVFTYKAIQILDPSADVSITNIIGGSISGTYDLSQASRNLTLSGGYLWLTGISGMSTNRITVASDHTLTFNTALRARNNWTVVLDGPGTVIYTNGLVGWSGGGYNLNILSGILSNKSPGTSLAIGRDDGGVLLQPSINQSGGTNYAQIIDLNPNARSVAYNLSGGLLSMAGDFRVGNSAGTGTGMVNVTGGTLLQSGGNFCVGYGGTGTNTGIYVQSGNSAVTVNVLRIAGAANTTGNFTISNGTFYAAAFDQFANTASSTGYIWLAGGTTTLPAFPAKVGYADITFDGGTLMPSVSTNRFLQGLNHAYLTANGALFDTAGNSITVSQVLENATGQAGMLTKTGTGRLVLAGVNTYTGATVIAAGTLALSGPGTIANSATITVGPNATASNATFDVSAATGGFTLQAGQTLTGNGLINGAATIASNAVLNPGTAGSGTLTFSNNLTLAGTWNVALSNDTINLLNVIGSLSVSNGALLNFSVSGTQTLGLYAFGFYSNALGTATNNFLLQNLNPSYSVQYDIPLGGSLYEMAVQIPEPSALTLVFLGVVGVWLLHRRK